MMKKIKEFYNRFGNLFIGGIVLVVVAVLLGLLSTCDANNGTLVDMFKN